MKGQLAWVNFVLLLVLGYTAWSAIEGYREARERYEIFQTADTGDLVPTLPEAATEPPLRSELFLAIAQRLLFSPDRNPVVEVEVEPEAAAPERPAFPYLAGLMDLGKGPVAWMSPEREGDPRPVRPGESVGEFEFVGATEGEIQLTWNDESFIVPFADMKGSEDKPAQSSRRASSGQRLSPALGGRPAAAAAPEANDASAMGGQYNIGREVTSGVFAADPKDDSPDGTEYQGYVKRVQQTPFGKRQFWVKKP